MTKRIVRIFMALVLLASFAACQRRPLEDMQEQVKIRVKVNIRAIANITTHVYNEHIPVPDLNTDMMRVMVYDPETKGLLTQSFIFNKEIDDEGNQVLSGNLNISYGDYDLVIYNFDTPTTQVTNENNENRILAYTPEISPAMRNRYFGTKADPSEPDYSNMLINYEPDHLVVAREHNLHVSPHDTVVVISTTATTIVDTYYIQIRVENAQFMAADGATAVISGLSPSNRFGPNIRTEDPSAAVVFNLYKSTDPNIPGANKDVICATFNTFGKIDNASSDLYVTFNIVDTAGNLQTYSTNLNTIFQSEDAIERHWLIINEVFTLEPPTPTTGGGGGFQPKVDDWEEEEGNMVI